MNPDFLDHDLYAEVHLPDDGVSDDVVIFDMAGSYDDAPFFGEVAAPEAPHFSGSSDWDVGINEDTGNTVSKWPGGRHFDNLTWDEVEPS